MDDFFKSKHQSHFEFNKALLDTIYNGIVPYFDEHGTMTKERFDQSFDKIKAFWSKIQPRFKSICDSCISENNTLYEVDARRNDFLTRILFSKIMAKIPERKHYKTDQNYPIMIAPHFKSVVGSLFNKTEYDLLNAKALSIYQRVKEEDDKLFWETVCKNQNIKYDIDVIFIRFMLLFKNFNMKKELFFNIFNKYSLSKDSEHRLSNIEFCELFETLFIEYETVALSENDRNKMDVLYGENTGKNMYTIFDSYFRYRANTKPIKGEISKFRKI